MESYLPITYLNDFIFCPRSIYFHQRFAFYNQPLYHNKAQTIGKIKHETIEEKRYSTSKYILQNMDVYSEKYKLCGKIDVYNQKTKELVERKYHINRYMMVTVTKSMLTIFVLKKWVMKCLLFFYIL